MFRVPLYILRSHLSGERGCRSSPSLCTSLEISSSEASPVVLQPQTTHPWTCLTLSRGWLSTRWFLEHPASYCRLAIVWSNEFLSAFLPPAHYLRRLEVVPHTGGLCPVPVSFFDAFLHVDLLDLNLKSFPFLLI